MKLCESCATELLAHLNAEGDNPRQCLDILGAAARDRLAPPAPEQTAGEEIDTALEEIVKPGKNGKP